MTRACLAGTTPTQRVQAEAYAAVVDHIPSRVIAGPRPRDSATPYLDGLAAAPAWHAVAAEVFAVAVRMVGRTHATLAADELVRRAGEVHASRLSTLDVRNIAVARAGRATRAEAAEDVVGWAQADVFEQRPRLVPPSPMLSPELIEAVTAYAQRLYDRPLTAQMREAIEAGLVCVIELIESYPLRDAKPGAALVSMQARQSGRGGRHLPTILRESGMDERAAVALARVLVGCDLDPQTALLWHALRRTPPRSLPARTIARLRRDLSDLDPSQFADDVARARLRRQLTREVRDEWPDSPGAAAS